ncbi:pyridoxamine 5'-phosphate oxidase family protein [Actinomadura flavalba]|uniref:pyridoxamine 5'-phosphate oxidase family protein n=1 Tax=Actinomadura flavalba TaxID=1120938 RepID=UPI000367651D|nr:pyridoxamine 5'-phosphate oxidase family protein [Actinomadura flavalba]
MDPVGELHQGFSEEGAEAVAWRDVEGVLVKAEMFFLSTTRRDGRPHVVPLPAVWDGGRLHFCTGAQEQKAKNLEVETRCVLATGSDRQQGGIDVVVEGAVVRVTGRERLTELAAIWKSKLDWDYDATDEGFEHPEGGPALVFAVTPEKILAFGKGPYTQTRFRPNT